MTSVEDGIAAQVRNIEARSTPGRRRRCGRCTTSSWWWSALSGRTWAGAGRIDLGLILPGTPPGDRLEPSGSFNALFTHRVKVSAPGEFDDALTGWLTAAYVAAG